MPTRDDIYYILTYSKKASSLYKKEDNYIVTEYNLLWSYETMQTWLLAEPTTYVNK